MHKTFTIEEANKSLVLVRPIITDLLHAYHKLGVLRSQANPAPEDEECKYTEKIAHFLDELMYIGCACKDMERGYVDFPSYQNDQLVHLCWRLGEEKVEHWHPLDRLCETRKPQNEPVARY